MVGSRRLPLFTMISFAPFEDRMSSGLRIEGKDTHVLLRKERIQALSPPLKQELLSAISKGLSKKPFDITNLMFDPRGAKTQTMEWRQNDDNGFVFFLFDRGVTKFGDWSMVLTHITDDTYPVIRDILLWINQVLNED
jgi:hypothetical protein